MDQEPKRRMDGMGPRVGMDGMARRPASQPAVRPAAPVPVPPPAPAPVPKRPARPVAPAPAPKPVAPAKPAPAPRPVQPAPAANTAQPPRRWLRRTLQGIAWLAIILAVASALVELYVRYYQ